MKTSVILSCCIGVLLSACATTAPTAASRSESSPEPSEQKIRTGMTKAQVRQIWGEPSGIDESPRGEVWVYGNSHMKRMIPYAGAFLNVNTSKVLFNSAGRVVDFRNTNTGSVWSQMEGMGGSGFSSW
jgi:outer membrane protein assembly factor BamE (lipoprotein component of BamABCDE complex)